MEQEIKRPEAYCLTFVVDGKLGFSEEITPGTVTASISAPEKTGYTFSGWMGLPVVMPEKDVTVYGCFTPNQHTITFSVEGEEPVVKTVSYGETIPTYIPKEKKGYTFSGFEGIPEVMPDADLVFEGAYLPNTYTVFYEVNGGMIIPEKVLCGSPIPEMPIPERASHTFSGWYGLPSVMPPHDITVRGELIPNNYDLIYVLDGEVVNRIPTPFGQKLSYPQEPTREGYHFLGWRGVPDTMPNEDVVVSGVFAVMTYRLEYRVDDACVFGRDIEYGTPLTALEEPSRVGMTFSGWDAVYETMPAHDVLISGSFTRNIYQIHYHVDEETVFSVDAEYASPIEPLVLPEKEGYIFSGWEGLLTRMPASDLKVTGRFLPIPVEEPEPVEDSAEAFSTEEETQPTEVEEITEVAEAIPEPTSESDPAEEIYVRKSTEMCGVAMVACKEEKIFPDKKLFREQKNRVTVYVSDEEILAVIGPDPKKRGNLTDLRFSAPTNGTVLNGAVVDRAGFLRIISDLWKENALPAGPAALVVDGANFREKVLEIPPVSNTKTMRHIAAQYSPSERLPAPIFSYDVIAENKALSKRYLFAVMSDRNDVNTFVEVFRAIGVRLQSLDTVLLSLIRALSGLCRGKSGLAQCVSGNALLTLLFVNGIYSYSVRSILPTDGSAQIWRKEAYTSAQQALQYAFEQGAREIFSEILIGSMNPSESTVARTGIAEAISDFYSDPEIAALVGETEIPAPHFCNFVYPVSGRA